MRDDVLPDRRHVMLRPSRRKKLAWLGFCLLIVGVGVGMLANGDPSGVPAMAAFALGAVGILVTLRTSYLRLEPNGFEFRSLVRCGQFGWDEVTGFRLHTAPSPTGGKDLSHVVIDLTPDAPRGSGRFARGRSTEIHEDYGLEAKELTQLLTIWKARYVTPRPPSRPTGKPADRSSTTHSAATTSPTRLLTERAFLVMIDGRTVGWAHTSILAGALLLDLERRGCLDGGHGNLTARDCQPGEMLLERTRNLIATSSTRRDAKGWVERLPKELGSLRTDLARSLVRRGLLVERSDKRLGIFRKSTFRAAGVAPREELEQSVLSAFRSAMGAGDSELREDECLLIALLIGRAEFSLTVPEEGRHYDAETWLKNVIKGWLERTRPGVRELQAAVLAAVDDAVTGEATGRWRGL